MTKDKDLNCPSEKILESRRKMLRNFGLGGAAIAASTLAAENQRFDVKIIRNI